MDQVTVNLMLACVALFVAGLIVLYVAIPDRVLMMPVGEIPARLRDYFRTNSMISSRNERLTYWFIRWVWTRGYYVSRALRWRWDAIFRRMVWIYTYGLRKPFCTACATSDNVLACFMDDNFTRIPDEYYCQEHIAGTGYCWCCGKWAFEILDTNRYGGLCETCHDDLGDDGYSDADYWNDDPWEYDFDDEYNTELSESDDWLDNEEELEDS